MTHVLVTGATGMLGKYVSDALTRMNIDAVAVDRSRFELGNPQGIFDYIMESKPAAVLHLAAETDVDLCERDPQRAGIRNHLATANIAKASAACGAWMLYVSTSNVFGGSGTFEHNELDLPCPLNYYGRSKLMGELEVRRFNPINHLIVRAGWMIGGGRARDHKFVGKVIEQILNGATSLRAVGDKYGSITRASLLAEFIVWALAQRHTGTVHYSSSGIVTRHNIAEQIVAALERQVQVASVRSSDFPLSAPRPFSEGMTSIYTPTLEGAPQPGNWKDDLTQYVETFLQ
ncbi:NAD(P)-dependent oxidoreductase [Rhizobium sp. R635]|uniref:SDR family oxidoreductase n=1 Tax=Rhizobium sp. R635 TaxID=1764275 RepID=UPI000B530C61|nr:SDR family oxidoreductase [Rhizobium sp. R635]OWV89208.1 NAD(P)-dependent oxidoreductase [Rhizobium sp. R635]